MTLSKNNSEQNKVIKTNQALIHIEHTISMMEYKLWFICLMTYRNYFEKGSKKDEDGFYYVSRSELSNLLGYRPKKEDLIGMVENLRLQPIRLNFFEKDGQTFDQRFRGMGFISEWDVGDKNLGFKFPQFLEKAIEGDEQARELFVLLNWNIFNSFTGKYEGIIYKLCKDYIGVGKTPKMSVEQFRTYLGLKDTEYKDTWDFNKRCINIPVKLINENELSDINVTVDYLRNGRKIEGLQFSAAYRSKERQPIEIPDFKPNPAFKKAKIYITPEDHSHYLSEFDSESIEKIINRANDYIESLEKKGSAKINIGAIYKKAFSEKWGLDVISKPGTLPGNLPDNNEGKPAVDETAPKVQLKTWDASLDQPLNVVRLNFPELTKEMIIEKVGNNFEKIQVLTHKLFIRCQYYKTSKKPLPALDILIDEVLK